MEYLIIIILYLLTLIIVYRIHKFVHHPSFIFGMIWMATSITYLIAYYFDIIEINRLSTKSFFIFYLGFLLFFIGGLISTKITINKKVFLLDKPLYIKKKLSIALHIISIIGIPLYIKSANEIIDKSSVSIDNWLMNLRHGLTEESLGLGIVSYVVTIVFFNFYIRVLGFGTKTDYWIALLLALAYAFLSTGRTFFLMIFTFIILDNLLKRKYMVLVYSVISFTITFIFIGNILVKFDTNDHFIVGILQYILGGMVAFDTKTLSLTDWNIHGIENILRTPIFILYTLDIVSTPPIKLIKEFVYVPFPTNVYTVYDVYLQDFGFLGMIFIMILGFFYGILFNLLKKSIIAKFFYLLMGYPLVMTIFQDQFFSLLSLWVQYAIILFTFLNLNRRIKGNL